MGKDDKKRAVITAVCGKGSVGKTTISAAAVRLLCVDSQKKILAVDADPSSGLASALGIVPRTTIDNVRLQLIEDLRGGSAGDRFEVLSKLNYGVFEALEERENMAFLAIGRPESAGCYCQVNDLLKDIIASVAANFDYVVIDGEAGIEQVNRRVMERVTHLLVVSDPSIRGLDVARAIWETACTMGVAAQAGLVINRAKEGLDPRRPPLTEKLPLLGVVPESAAVREGDIRGDTFFSLDDRDFLAAVEGCLVKAGVVRKSYSL